MAIQPKECTRPENIAWQLHPNIVYWAAIRVLAHASQGPYSNEVVPEITMSDAIKRWAEDHGVK